MKPLDVTYEGEPIENPYLAALAATFVVLAVFFVAVLILITWPIWVPLHFILHAFGLKGFFQPGRLFFGFDSFKKRAQ